MRNKSSKQRCPALGKDQLDDLELHELITLRILNGIAWDFRCIAYRCYFNVWPCLRMRSSYTLNLDVQSSQLLEMKLL